MVLCSSLAVDHKFAEAVRGNQLFSEACAALVITVSVLPAQEHPPLNNDEEPRVPAERTLMERLNHPAERQVPD
jgi:hypothetical protein